MSCQGEGGGKLQSHSEESSGQPISVLYTQKCHCGCSRVCTVTRCAAIDDVL